MLLSGIKPMRLFFVAGTNDQLFPDTVTVIKGQGRILIDPVNRVVGRGFESEFFHDVTTTIDPLGNRTSFAYDLLNRLTQEQDALSDISTVVYDADSNVIAAVDPLGHRTSYGYDAIDRLTSVTDALNHTTSYALDAVGNVTKTTDPLGAVTSFSYDALNRETTMTDATGHVSSVIYDADSNVTATVDPLGNRTSYAYDAINRLTQETNALSGLLTAAPATPRLSARACV
jgi:YD repeat-containing protein